MDELDRQILSSLKSNARMTASAIGDTIGLSVSAVSERIKRMERSGVIRGYTVATDPHRMGQDVCAFICVSLEHSRHNTAFMQAVRDHEKIIECQYVTGDFDFLVKVLT
ncbi:MAG: Lrp/AsnC family transcriptional regulator, partial [Clostridia bacterium]|nr:Lrp/AsnC family transcriptional regulator [Clostridia bacterium]